MKLCKADETRRASPGTRKASRHPLPSLGEDKTMTRRRTSSPFPRYGASATRGQTWGAGGALLLTLLSAAPAFAQSPLPPQAKNVGSAQVVARDYGATFIGVAVSPAGRVFLSFPRAFDPGPYCVAELKAGRFVPYPSAAVNQVGSAPQSEKLVSVQGLTVDAHNRLWLLDTGIIKTNPTQPGGPKLVCVDLATNQITRKIVFGRDIAGPNAYLNDVRIDLKIGAQGTAFITDSSEKGPNGVVVVDLATGKAMRRLNNHPSTMYEAGYVPVVEGQPLLKREPGKSVTRDKTGADGLTLSGDGKNLFYAPNEGLRLYRIPVAVLANMTKSDSDINAAVVPLGPKPGPTDGMESDRANRVYVTDYAHNAVERYLPSGKYETVLQGPRLIWPDSIAFGPNGFMYLTVDQLDRQKKYHHGHDLRRRPFLLVRVRTDSQPVQLK